MARIWREELRKQSVFTEQLAGTKQEDEAGGGLGHVKRLATTSGARTELQKSTGQHCARRSVPQPGLAFQGTDS